MFRFNDRHEAGRLMVALLSEFMGKPGVMVMPVRARAAEVAEGLSEAMGAGFVAPDADASELDELSGATVVLVDDGFNSTERLREAAMVARGCGAVRVV